MDSIINLQKKIVPELTDLLVQRYQILRQVSHEAPIGRRALAARLGLSERVLRAQVDFLKKSGLLDFSSSGMSVTDEGADILKELADYVRKLQDISFLESTLSDTLKIGKVVILPGDSDQEDVVKREIGRTAAHILSKLLSDGNKHIVAVSGGTTMAAMAANVSGSQPNTVVVPARGGLGDNVELQANTIATVLAQKLAHLSCSFIRKGNRHNVVWIDAHLVDQVGRPVRQHTRLTGTGSGQYQQRSFCGLYRFLLLFIQ